MTLYLDLCCLKRPLDDQTEERVRLESQAILIILARCDRGQWGYVSSEVLEDENALNPDPDRRERTARVLRRSRHRIALTDAAVIRAEQLISQGFKDYDALHMACAVSGRVDVLLTTDDRFLSRARKLAVSLELPVRGPVEFLGEALA